MKHTHLTVRQLAVQLPRRTTARPVQTLPGIHLILKTLLRHSTKLLHTRRGGRPGSESIQLPGETARFLGSELSANRSCLKRVLKQLKMIHYSSSGTWQIHTHKAG